MPFFVADSCHPQTISVVQTRAKALGLEIAVGAPRQFEFSKNIFGALLQYPTADGAIEDYRSYCQRLMPPARWWRLRRIC
jgi:glycine dehydrogenase